MNYLQVDLEPGQQWNYRPPAGHDVGWVAVADGVLKTPGTAIPKGELAIFERSEEPLEFVAEGKTRFVLGSAAKHPHDLVMGMYSVHTSREALHTGEARIQQIGQELRAKGTI
jgi:redox-sensitive bicupin YhaK (pirin superfamily)